MPDSPQTANRINYANRRSGLTTLIISVGFVVAVVSGFVSYRVQGRYGDLHESDPHVRKEFDPQTGELTLVVFASDGNLRVDTWSYMKGERLTRMDVDDDGDGKIDRRSFYSLGEVLDRTEYLDSTGQLIRTEYQNGRLGRPF